MPYLIRITAAVALVVTGTTWLLSAVPLPLVLLLAIPGAWVMFDLVQP